MQATCNRDCFYCEFPNCICDDLTHADYRELAEIDRELMHSPKSKKQKKAAAHQKAYREANREKIAAYQKAYWRKKKARAAEQKEQE